MELRVVSRAGTWWRFGFTVVIALAGVSVFAALALPLPWLLGPLFACLIAALAGLPLRGWSFGSTAVRTVLGVAVGASITPALVARLGEMAVSVALVPLFVAAIGVTGYPYFRRLCGFDRATSFYGAMPGGLQDMLVFGAEAGGSPRVLSLIHATRLLIIVSALPFLMVYGLELDLARAPGQAAGELPLWEMGLMLAIGIAGWAGANAVGMFGASILGPMILAAIASLSGLLTHRPPSEAILAAQFMIGLGVGVHYVGITMAEVRRVILASVGYTAILALLAAGFIGVAVGLKAASLREAILAFSPGGQAEMAVLAIVVGADVAFVVTHHILRIVIVILGAPVFFRLTRD